LAPGGRTERHRATQPAVGHATRSPCSATVRSSRVIDTGIHPLIAPRLDTGAGHPGHGPAPGVLGAGGGRGKQQRRPRAAGRHPSRLALRHCRRKKSAFGPRIYIGFSFPAPLPGISFGARVVKVGWAPVPTNPGPGAPPWQVAAILRRRAVGNSGLSPLLRGGPALTARHDTHQRGAGGFAPGRHAIASAPRRGIRVDVDRMAVLYARERGGLGSKRQLFWTPPKLHCTRPYFPTLDPVSIAHGG
jgi:hypothetical protein